MVNAKIGDKFENEFAEILNKLGYYAHVIAKSKTGSQPCDVFACKNNIPYMFDCKTLKNKNGLFPTHRIEENQRLAYKKYRKCGNFSFSLAILWENNIYLKFLHEIDFDKPSLDLKKEQIWRKYEN